MFGVGMLCTHSPSRAWLHPVIWPLARGAVAEQPSQGAQPSSPTLNLCEDYQLGGWAVPQPPVPALCRSLR